MYNNNQVVGRGSETQLQVCENYTQFNVILVDFCDPQVMTSL